MDVTKADKNTIEVTKTPDPVTTTYTYDYLLKQKQSIQDQKDRDNTQRDIEITEVDNLLAQADRLGVVSMEASLTSPAVEVTQ